MADRPDCGGRRWCGIADSWRMCCNWCCGLLQTPQAQISNPQLKVLYDYATTVWFLKRTRLAQCSCGPRSLCLPSLRFFTQPSLIRRTGTSALSFGSLLTLRFPVLTRVVWQHWFISLITTISKKSFARCGGQVCITT